MITLHWHQVTDLRIEAQHRDFVFSIVRKPNFTRRPRAMEYDYEAAATHGSDHHDLGTFTKSAGAKCAAFNFINEQAGDSRG